MASFITLKPISQRLLPPAPGTGITEMGGGSRGGGSAGPWGERGVERGRVKATVADHHFVALIRSSACVVTEQIIPQRFSPIQQRLISTRKRCAVGDRKRPLPIHFLVNRKFAKRPSYAVGSQQNDDWKDFLWSSKLIS